MVETAKLEQALQAKQLELQKLGFTLPEAAMEIDAFSRVRSSDAPIASHAVKIETARGMLWGELLPLVRLGEASLSLSRY